MEMEKKIKMLRDGYPVKFEPEELDQLFELLNFEEINNLEQLGKLLRLEMDKK